MNKDAFIIQGDLRVSIAVYGATMGQVIVRADVVYREKSFQDVPLLVLSIDADLPELTNDVYFPHLPYLKPSKLFRNVLSQALEAALHQSCRWAFISSGVGRYLTELRSFSEARSIVNQAKREANALDANKPGSEKRARAVLVALGKPPVTEMEVIIWPSRTN